MYLAGALTDLIDNRQSQLTAVCYLLCTLKTVLCVRKTTAIVINCVCPPPPRVGSGVL